MSDGDERRKRMEKRNRADDLPKSYDRLAGEYARRLFDELNHKPLDRALLARFAQDIRELRPVCDLGCGPGHVTRHLRGLGVEAFGVDLSAGMVE
jgi:predicted TPR repeat methyltransferase